MKKKKYEEDSRADEECVRQAGGQSYDARRRRHRYSCARSRRVVAEETRKVSWRVKIPLSETLCSDEREEERVKKRPSNRR